MIWVFGIITLGYLLLMLFLLFGLGKVPERQTVQKTPEISFSVAVPFRNEAYQLPTLFSSLKKINYPSALFEIILINDDSDDDSEDIARIFIASSPELDIKLLESVRTSGSPKKDALDTAIKEAAHNYILTTDADCSVPQNWLLVYSSFILSSGAHMISGPVRIRDGKGMWAKFQEMDFFSLQAATMGAFGVEKPFMCNGANLCYRKRDYQEVQGFQGNADIASGDDVFLLAKFQDAGLKTAFLKNPEATVITAAQPNLRSLFFQRIRWAAKATAYQKAFPKVVGAAVFLMNLLLLVGLAFYLTGADVRNLLLFAFLIKFNIDFVVIYRAADFFGKESRMKNYYWVSILYPFFTAAVVVSALFKGFRWKGRRFKK